MCKCKNTGVQLCTEMDWSTLIGILFWKKCALFTLSTALATVLLTLKTLVVNCKTSTTWIFRVYPKDFKDNKIKNNNNKINSGNSSGNNRDFWFGFTMFAYQKQKVCSCGGGGRGGGGFFLVYVIGLNDPRPRLDENRRVRQCETRERKRGKRRRK